MHRIHVSLVVAGVASFLCSTPVAAELLSRPSCCTGCTENVEIPADDCGCTATADRGTSCNTCQSSCTGCGGCGCGVCGCHRARIAEAGCFNCTCKGSYKFPVPPQYTYHWPGMYSQQFMTEYVSPYRFPPLELPSFIPQEKAQAPVAPVIRSSSDGLMAARPSQLAPLPKKASSRPMPMSARIKQKYGLK